MNLEKLYKLQEALDNHILENRVKRTGKEIDKKVLLEQTTLALLVEIGELANTTRCFKHWSTKGPMEDEVILDELADVWHFYLSIGNQTGRKLHHRRKDLEGSHNSIINTFNSLYYWVTRLKEFSYSEAYEMLGIGLTILQIQLNFTDKQVEQAYLKKHEENYKRQREGY